LVLSTIYLGLGERIGMEMMCKEAVTRPVTAQALIRHSIDIIEKRSTEV
jgi:hypothetical protein